MKKNKKLLMLFVAVNIAVSGNANTGLKSSEYNRLYKKIVENMEKNSSNKQNYQLIEENLKEKNTELNDLYIQSDYVVKPEFLEWQVMFSGFYAKNIKGDNTLENADYYSTVKTKSGKLTIHPKTYEELIASGLSESQIMALFNGERDILNSLTDEQKSIFYNQKNQTGVFKSFHKKELPNNIKLGASIPIKEVLDFTLNPQINIVEKTITPINVNLPNTRVEKIMITDLREIKAPEPSVNFVPVDINSENIDISPVINFNFTAGHNAGAPKILGGTGVGHQTNVPVNSIKHTGDVTPITRYYIVNSSGHQLYFSQNTDFTFSNTGTNPNGRFYAENSGAAKILANYGTLRIGAGSSDAFIFGDTVDSTSINGIPFSTTVYNSGKMYINADVAGQAGVPGGVGMAYLSNGDDKNGGAKQRYLVNGLKGEIFVNGWGNYGILMNQVDSLNEDFIDSIRDNDINLLINKGQVIINVSSRPDGETAGNVGVAAFADNGTGTGNDNSFILNDSEGTIRSESGNNVLLRHMGTGHVWNKGILEIGSAETIGLDKRNWLFNTTVNSAREARGINDGIIIVKDVENVKSVSGIADTKKHDSTINTDRTVLIKNGDGNSFESDYVGDGTGGLHKDISKGSLGMGLITPSIGANKGMSGSDPGIVADTTYLDDDLELDEIIFDKSRTFDMTINGKAYNYTTHDGVIFLEGRNSVGLISELKNVENDLPNLNLIKAVNDIDGKIFIYSKGNTASQYTIGINGSYSTIENKGGIFFGIVPENGVINGLASGVVTEGAVSAVGNYNYIGIYGSGSHVTNSGFITDKAGAENYSQNAIGIYAENKDFSGVSVGEVINTGNITLGTGGKAIITKGVSPTAKINLSSTGEINVSGDDNNLGAGFVLENTNADISNKINLSKGKTTGIYTIQSNLQAGGLNITGNSIKGSYGLYLKNSELKLDNGVNINLTGGANNIGVYGEAVRYTDGMSANKNDHLNITLGKNGIGIYLKNLVSDTSLKINKINTENSISGGQSGGIYAVSDSGSINIDSGEIKIGNNPGDGKGFGIYVSGKSTGSGTINLGTSDITVNQKSGLGIFAENVSNITTGNITAGNVGIFHSNTGTAGTIKTGKIKLLGSEDNMLGLYTTGNATNVEINGLDMSGLNNLTGIYVKNGGFKNTGNISVSGGNESYGIYVVGNASNKTVDFGSGITNIILGNESLGLYLDNTDVTGNMPVSITVGNSSSTGKQSVGIYANETSFSNAVNTNVISGNESVGVYFNKNTGNIEYNGNVTLGENSMGVYKNGGIISRNPNSSILFTGINNAQSTGFYLENSTLNFTSGLLNTNTLSMDSGIAFLLKGNGANVQVNGVNIKNEQLDSLGLAPKVERIVYSEKNEVITGDINLDPAVRYYGHRAKGGRLEINGNIYANNNINSTYGVAVQDKYTAAPVNEEVLLKNAYVIDMSNSSGSMGIQSLAGARAKNQGKIIVGSSNALSSGIGILAESKSTSDLTSITNDITGLIEMPNAGIGIYIDSAELGGSVLNAGSITSAQSNALGIYAKLSSGGIIGVPKTIIENTGTISLANEGFGIFAENSEIINSGNIKADYPLSNKIVGIYGGKKSEIYNTGGTITAGENGIAFYGDNTDMFISGGTFDAESGTLIYAINNSKVNYAVNGVTLGNKIGIYLDESKIDFNGKDLNVSDNGSAIYMIGLSSEAKSLGNLNLGNNSEGAYVKNATLNSLGGNINITGSNSTGIIGINSNIENTSNINTYMSNSTSGNKGMLLKVDDGGIYNIKNKAVINLQASNSLGMYGSALDSNGNVFGTLNLTNENTVSMGSSFDINNVIIGMYGTKGVNLSNTTGNITGGNYTVGMYSAGGNITNISNISLGDAGVAVYLSGGTGLIDYAGGIKVGNGIRKIDTSGKEVIESGVAFYASNGAVLENRASDISVGRDSIIGYSKDKGTKIINYGNISLGEEAIGFYANSGEVENHGILTSSGDGVIYFYGKNGKMVNNNNINGAGNNYGVGMYGKDSEIINNANIYLGDTYYNPAKADNPSDSSHRYAVGIYGDKSEIYNDGEIHIGKRGIGIYSYGQTGDLINGINGKIISNSDNAVGLLAEGSGSRKVINNGKIILSGKTSVGVSINRNTTLINNGLIEVNGESSVGILAEANSTVINNATVKSLGASIAAIVLKGGSVLENHGSVTGLVLSDDESNAVDDSSSISVTASNISDYLDKLPGSAMPSYTKPTIVNSGIINVDNNFVLDGINLIIKPDLQNPDTSVISSENTDFIYNAVRVNGGKIDKNMLVEVTPDFAEGTSATTIQMLKTFISSSGLDIADFDIISQSIMWSITPSYNKEDSTSIDLIASKKTFGSLSGGLWYESFANNLDKKYSGSTGDALKIYNKVNWLTTDKDLRHIMSSMAGNIYANINQREQDIEITFDNSINFLQESSNNTKENVKINVIGGKGKLEEDTDGVVSYDYKTAGVVALREVERTYRHTFGYSAGYAHTSFELDDGNSSKETADTIQLGLHNKYEINKWKLKNNLTGRVSFHDTDRNIMWPTKDGKSKMNARYEVYSISSDNILSKELFVGRNGSVSTYGALKTVYMNRPSFSEDGLEALKIDGNDAWSIKPRAGIELKAKRAVKGTAWNVKGTLDLAYEYELANINEREHAKLKAVEDGYHKLSKPEEDKGSFRTKASFGVEVEERYGIFITGEYLTGSNDKEDYRTGVSLKAVF